MRLESREIINRPIDEVYQLVRDDLPKLVPYLPNVDKIEVKKHAPTNGSTLEVVNHWYGKAEVPGFVKKFLKPEIFSWKDTAIWNNEGHYVEYELESFLANDLFDAKGKNTFVSVEDDKTELTVSCDITIYADKVPGVPRILAKKVMPAVEALLEKLLRPNLESLGKGLNDYFQSH